MYYILKAYNLAKRALSFLISAFVTIAIIIALGGYTFKNLTGGWYG